MDDMKYRRFGKDAVCKCCGMKFHTLASGRPPTMCHMCRALPAHKRPGYQGNAVTVSCKRCGKAMVADSRFSTLARGHLCKECKAESKIELSNKNIADIVDANEGSCEVRSHDFVNLHTPRSWTPATYDLGACDRCAYRSSMDGRSICLMQKPGFMGTCEWFSETMVRRPRVEVV